MIDPQLIKVFVGYSAEVSYINVSQIIAVNDTSNDHRNEYTLRTALGVGIFHVEKDSPAGKVVTRWIESAIG